MPAKGSAAHWRKPPGDAPLMFERGSTVVTPSARKAVLTQYWTSPSHEYAGCASIKYEDNGETAIISLSLLKQWQPGKTYAPPPLVKIRPIPASPKPGSLPICAHCPHKQPRVHRWPKVPDCQLSFPFFEAAA